jgi:3-carboxy-cis,cis-muconate cycloisomerase
LADELGLGAGPCWHTERDGIAEHVAVMAMVAGGLGKIGQDACLMAQQGVEEIALARGGGSSAMAHKRNPVLAELLVSLARYAAGHSALAMDAQIHEQERSGAAWTLEWLVLPTVSRIALRSLSAAIDLVGTIDEIGDI